jgi:hypothetical protein
MQFFLLNYRVPRIIMLLICLRSDNENGYRRVYAKPNRTRVLPLLSSSRKQKTTSVYGTIEQGNADETYLDTLVIIRIDYIIGKINEQLSQAAFRSCIVAENG